MCHRKKVRARMITLDKAIKHAEEVSESNEERIKSGFYKEGSRPEAECRECAEDHRQLASWLKEYKELKELTGKLAFIREVGFWKQSGMNSEIYRCSNCRVQVSKNLLIQNGECIFKFCPCCGARMERTEETKYVNLQKRLTEAMNGERGFL